MALRRLLRKTGDVHFLPMLPDAHAHTFSVMLTDLVRRMNVFEAGDILSRAVCAPREQHEHSHARSPGLERNAVARTTRRGKPPWEK